MSELPDTPSDVTAAWERILDRLRSAVDGEFEILREIGSGGMAAVYLARQIALNRQVAIKVMSPALLTGDGMVERFRQEAITIAGLDHPNIITIYAVRHHGDLHFFVMKFIKGRSLEHIIRANGPLPVPMVRGLLFMVGSALAHAHRRNVIHRDVKPANILVDGEGNAIVTDFGIAKVSEGQSSAQTHSGVIIGTASYMSPEQCYASPAKAASDQYSLGIVAYEMLTGHPPFRGSQFVVMQAHTERPVPSIREQRRDCPAELEAAIMRMLAKDPADRWPSMQHALAELGAAPLLEGHPVRAALAKLGVPDREKTEPQPVPKPYVSSVAILAPPDWIEAGDELTLRASARSWSGGTMPGVVIHWHAEPRTVASVDEAHGIVTALTPGIVVITASVEDVTTTVTLQVVPRRVASVTVSIPPGTMHVGDRVQLVARMEDKSHVEVKKPVAWVTSDSRVGTVSDVGILTCRAPGLALIFAEAEGRRGSAEVMVAPARVSRLKATMAPSSLMVGDRIHLGATALDAMDQILDDRVVSWISRNPRIATVTVDGLVTALAAGHGEFVCSCEGKSAVVELDVEEVIALATVSTVDTGSASVAGPDDAAAAPAESISDIFNAASEVGRPPLTPQPLREESPLEGLPFRLDSPPSPAFNGVRTDPPLETRRAIGTGPSALGVGEASGTRLALPGGRSRRLWVTGGAALVVLVAWVALAKSGAGGRQQLRPDTATAGQQGGAVVKPSSGQPDSTPPKPAPPAAIVAANISIAGIPKRVVAGDAFGLTGEVRDASGALLANHRVRWRSTVPSVATVDRTTGRVATHRDGQTTLVAESDDKTESATLTVAKPAAVEEAAVITVATPSAPIRVRGTVALRASTSGGPPAPEPIAWSSEASAVVQVDATGIVTGVSEGTATITAKWRGKSATVRVTVIPAAVATVAITPTTAKMTEGDQVSLQASIRDDQGSVLSGREVVWRSDSAQVASVNNSGVVTARHAGAAVITATVENHAGRAAITVVPKPVAAPAAAASTPSPTGVAEATIDRGAADAAIASKLGEFVAAINAHDEARLKSMVNDPASSTQIEGLLRSSEVRSLRAADPQRSPAQFGDNQVTQDFKVALSWTNSVRHKGDAVASCRAVFALRSGAWVLQTIRILNSLQ